jgi:DNA-binding NtrC family response regulator
VGSGKVEQLNIRFICATNRDPHIAISEKKLREDLFYRLNVISIFLPPLCERGNDTIQLAEHFLSHYSKLEGKGFAGFSAQGKSLLKEYPWPGNVRQLQNIIHSAVVMSEGPLISDNILKQQLNDNVSPSNKVSALPKQIVSSESLANDSVNLHTVSQADSEIISLEKVERQAIEQAILICQDNIVKAASELGVSPSTLYRKIQQWQTQPPE